MRELLEASSRAEEAVWTMLDMALESLKALHHVHNAEVFTLHKKASKAHVEGFNEGAKQTAEKCGKASEVLGQVEKVVQGHVGERVFGIKPKEKVEELSEAHGRGFEKGFEEGKLAERLRDEKWPAEVLRVLLDPKDARHEKLAKFLDEKAAEVDQVPAEIEA